LRLLAKHGRVNAFKLRSGTLTDFEVVNIQDAAARIRDVPLWWDDQPCQTVGRIAAQARRLKAKHNLAIVIVDYMQLIEAADRRQKRYEAVGEMSRGLKLLARELQIPVVAMAQLNRESEAANREPKLSDLREAGGIEQDADTVILMHPATNSENDPCPQIKLLIRKQRNGPLSSVIVMHDKAHYALLNAATDAKKW
jgi:replicative DNA helicase